MRPLWLLLLAVPSFAADPRPGEPPNRWIEFRRELHRRPELGNRETETMKKIASALRAIGIADVQTGVAKTGVVATIKGGRPGPTIALRAPIDAFPIAEKRASAYRSMIPGVSHACGHDAMVAMVLGAAEALARRRQSLGGAVKLIFQPAEEGAPEGEPGGAPLMVREGALQGVSAIVALHVDDQIPCGEVGVHPDTVYAGADTFKIKVEGRSAHGATPWKGVDAIAVAAQIVGALQQLASRQADINDPLVVTVGTIHGGARSNQLAGEVLMSGTLRSYSVAGRLRARESLRMAVEGTGAGLGAKATVAWSEELGPVVNNRRLVEQLSPVLESRVGAGKLRRMKPMSYADDFSAMSEKAPSFYFQLGIRNEARGITAATHTEEFDVDERCIPLGASLLADAAAAALELR